MTEFSKVSDLTPVRREPAARRGMLSDEQIDSLESWLESRFAVPGTRLHFGLDGLLGLIPGIGDTITAGLSAIIILDAHKKGARKRTLVRMVSNSLIDLVIGAIPLIGDLFDFAYKSNTKNVKLLKQELRDLEDEAARN
uniref:DUF4112 domain-containing protein n=1 Tax=Pararhizobium sp. IMCC3301 TaxID=3067904 RepID=UPI0027409D1A|nr:DUF4112 domain-containing protein [Pararhizobium sp. IMCC3301]